MIKTLCRIVFLTILSLMSASKGFSQVKNYEAQWKQVESLLYTKHLPKSALAEVKKIYELAKKENQPAQVIKALVYMSGVQDETREDNEVLSIAELEKEIASAKEPASSILKNLLANRYWTLFQNSRWNIYNRTQTANYIKNDPNTWTVADFHEKISNLYLASLQNEKLLKATSLEAYNAIIIKGNVRHLRPTLYDLLAHEALEYFGNDERDLNKPAYAFEINQPEAYAPAAEFAAFRFTTSDTLSLQHKALLIYQDLISFHLADKNPEALIDADLTRIQFVHTHSTAPNKDSLYLRYLQDAVARYKGHPASKQAGYLLASHYFQQGAKYTPGGDTTARFDKVKARDILAAIVKDSSVKNEGWANSFNLLREIEDENFRFEVEKVNVPGQPFRALVHYNNLPTLYFRLIPLTEALRNQLAKEYGEKRWAVLWNATPLRTWQQNLPATNDFQDHSTEVKIDALKPGEYILLGSSRAEPGRKGAIVGYGEFYVSNISFINRDREFFILNRDSGQPLSGATVNLFKETYDQKTSAYIKKIAKTYKADANGYIKLDQEKGEYGSSTYYPEVLHGGDRLMLDQSIYIYTYSRTPEPGAKDNKIIFFTDRSIYRPGQTVYFKGIVLQGENKETRIVPGHKATVYLRDANHEVVDSLKLTSNEFGSISGKFQLPQSRLNGEFAVMGADYRSIANFSVEEYKRPKFQVEFEKVKESYKVNSEVALTGTAKAYAGNNVDGAKVSYRVVRMPRFLYPWLTWKWMPPSEQMEIAHGETTTDAEGKFIIRFKAIPDLKLDPKLEPVFDYTVYADVTDINGETRSGTYSVSAGYKSLVLRVTLPERVAADQMTILPVETQNMNGAYLPANLQVSITKLIPENRLIRGRLWQRPDQFVMTREEFVRHFPYDEYDKESDYKTWQRGETVVSFSDSSRVNDSLPFPKVKLQPGFYAVEVTARNKEGEEVKDVRYVEVFDQNSNSFTRPEYLWTKGPEGPIEPGEATTIQVGSAADNVFIVQETNKEKSTSAGLPTPQKNKNIKHTVVEEETGPYTFITLNREKKTFQFRATEADRGGYGVQHFFVKHNRLYQTSDVVIVPWSNKQLKVEFATFRDKTLPGSQEKWKVKISGQKNELVAAEMLASMYDASLDQFRLHNWEKPYIWPYYSPRDLWSGYLNFASQPSQQRWTERSYRSYEKRYDELFTSIQEHYSRRLNGYATTIRPVMAQAEMSSTAARSKSAPEERAMTGNDASAAVSADSTGVAQGWMSAPPPMPGKDGTPPDANVPQAVQVRKNLNETAFFFPELRTSPDGSIEFSFTAPEALTRWKLQAFAHSKDLSMELSQQEMVTQKELMVQPNAPRFLRQGDRMEFSAKIVNLSSKELTGQAELQLVDAATNQPVDGWFMNTFPNQYFTVAAGQSQVVNFPIEVPFQFTSSLVWRVIARSGDHSDGEEMALPVLTNRMLVTETLPLPMRGTGTKQFTFKKLTENNSESLQHHSLTVEYTSNPVWYAVQALPYLMEYPYECSEQTWNRYYANALATGIANRTPRLRQIFDKWKNLDSAALLSNLQKNEELKNALLEETPWVLEAKTEEQRKKNIGLLLDMARMSNELKVNLQKLGDMQLQSGGFPWFKGGREDRYITQYILTGFGRLRKLKMETGDQGFSEEIAPRALAYLDRKIRDDYNQLVKSKADKTKNNLGPTQVQYLYMRSFFPHIPVAAATKTAYNYYLGQAKKFWTKQDKQAQGMIAVATSRSGDAATAAAILKSLKESSVNSEELGMYWKENRFGRSWFWYHSPIETQAVLAEAFSEAGKDVKTVDDIRTWLIRNKQTNDWGTTKATADACYALLLRGTDWTGNEPVVEVRMGNLTASTTEANTEAGTGYFKKKFDARAITPEVGNVSVTVKQEAAQGPSTMPSWGAVYWQYFEDLDKITGAATPLQLNKKLFVEKNTDRGPVLTPVNDDDALKVGDKVKVRIELRVDRDMEYVHMKDLRASALEPVNVLSGYKWQNSLYYYESTRDLNTSFFFDYLPKGTYVFEYPLFVTHTGNFSNGITSIQCLYAPEFASHSEGVRIRVD
jgi:hypothetical protein